MSIIKAWTDRFKKPLPPMLSEYADPEKSIYKYRYCCFTEESPAREVIIYSDTPSQALAVAVSHFDSQRVSGELPPAVGVREVGCIWIDEHGRQHTKMMPGYDAHLHVDQGHVHCDCCKDKAGLPEAWRKKGDKNGSSERK